MKMMLNERDDIDFKFYHQKKKITQLRAEVKKLEEELDRISSFRRIILYASKKRRIDKKKIEIARRFDRLRELDKSLNLLNKA